MSVVATIKDKCKSCFACIRNCPVKAIKVEDGQAKVVDERCISCGNCVRICAQKAKKITWDSKDILDIIKSHPTVAIVAPSYAASFPQYTFDQLKALLIKIGFSGVEEVTLGVELTIDKYINLIKENEKPVISAYCPALVGLIEKHYPEAIKYLAPIDSAMTATAKYVKKKYLEHKVVFIGPCVAKKEEALIQKPQVIDGVMTFRELKEYFKEGQVDLPAEIIEDEEINNDFKDFPLAGGLVKNLKMDPKIVDSDIIITEGFENCIEIIKDVINQEISPKFLDLLVCRGCIDGPEIDSPVSLYTRKGLILNRKQGRSSLVEEKYLPIKIERCYEDKHQTLKDPSEPEVKEILRYTYKINPEDELNCGACGYQTCRDKAVAVFQGFAEIDMCFPYLINKTRGELDYYRDRLQGKKSEKQYLDHIIGESKEIIQLKKMIEKAANTTTNVLIQGDSGVGKGIVANAIHYLSNHNEKPFIEVNCSAFPELMLETELLGYEEGAFTGARKGGKPGKFELSNGGTIYFAEVHEMPLNVQGLLLGILQENKVERIGGTELIPLDIRVLASTREDLSKLVQEGKFRVDLFYRLNVINFTIPPLKVRRGDIPLLAGHFLQQIAKNKNLQPKILAADAMDILINYEWPGNIKELENVIERAMFLADGAVIQVEHLLPTLEGSLKKPGQIRPIKDAVRELEEKLIREALAATNNNRVSAAALLGMPRATLYQKLKEFNIQ